MTTMGTMVFNTSPQMLDVLRLAQNNPKCAEGRAQIAGIAMVIAGAPPPTTDEAEKARRLTMYKSATAMLAWAGAVMNDAVENGMDVSELRDPLSFILLAAAGFTKVTAVDMRD